MSIRSAIIVHGKISKEGYYNPDTPSASNSIWIPWLQNELLLREIPTQTPEIFRAFQPDYKLWSETFSQYTITPETMLIGHSCGGGFLTQWLSEHKDVRVGHVILVAPAFGDALNPEARYDVEMLNGFGQFELDETMPKRVGSLTLLYSDNDSVRVESAVNVITTKYSEIDKRLFKGYGHFARTDDGAIRTKFPEILDIIDYLPKQT